MTKSEFDEQFLAGILCVEHETAQQWRTISTYAETLGIRNALSEHDVFSFPYAYVCKNYELSAFGRLPRLCFSITFAEFCDALATAEECDVSFGDLSDIL